MTRRGVRVALASILFLGLCARLVAWRLEPAIHCDEFFQVTEPPFWHLSGVGLTAWEWKAGVRSWVLPGYHGAWMALLMALGVRRGATLGSLLQLHWAVINLALVALAYRGGALITRHLGRPSPPEVVRADRAPPAGWQGGLLAALACALFPMVVAYAPHTLSELPAMLLFLHALVLTEELVEPGTTRRPARTAVMIGALLSASVCVRIANGPLALVGPLVLLVHRRHSLLPWLAVGAAGPVLLFGLVDLVTWGTFLGSFAGYLRFNLIEGRAAAFGTEPRFWYWQILRSRVPMTFPLLVLPALVGLRATWPFVLSAFGLLAMLGTQAHKEERFVIVFWPLLLIASAGVAGAWLTRATADMRGRASGRGGAAFAVLAGVAVLLGDDLLHFAKRKGTIPRAWFEGQAAAADDGATALLIDQTYTSGGALWFGSGGPQLSFDVALLGNLLFSHALVRLGSDKQRHCLEAGFVPLFSRDGVVLLRRPARGGAGQE